jgi:hypothetical protein
LRFIVFPSLRSFPLPIFNRPYRKVISLRTVSKIQCPYTFCVTLPPVQCLPSNAGHAENQQSVLSHRYVPFADYSAMIWCNSSKTSGISFEEKATLLV